MGGPILGSDIGVTPLGWGVPYWVDPIGVQGSLLGSDIGVGDSILGLIPLGLGIHIGVPYWGLILGWGDAILGSDIGVLPLRSGIGVIYWGGGSHIGVDPIGVGGPYWGLILGWAVPYWGPYWGLILG